MTNENNSGSGQQQDSEQLEQKSPVEPQIPALETDLADMDIALANIDGVKTDARHDELDNPVDDHMYWVGIGASAGGLEALREMLKGLPSVDSNVTYIIAQHLSPKYQSMLVQLLGRETSMQVEEVLNGINPSPGVFYITPPNNDVFVRGGALYLRKPLSEMSPKPSVDYFFTTLAEDRRDHAISVILSGTGSDGSRGMRAIRAEGGLTITQDPEDAKYDGMPRNAIATGCVDLVLKAKNIGPQILSIINSPRNLKALQESEITLSTMQELMHMLKEQSGVDFKDYKSGTLFRRINRRMTACGTNNLDSYLEFVKEKPEELDMLFKDIMITVTNFFRDKEAFESLLTIIKKTLQSKKEGDDIRVWVPGCATGEEAYSIAILFAEAAGGVARLQQHYNFQLFATDIDSDALLIGRKGVYSQASLDGMNKDIRKKYFRQKEENTFEVMKSIRELVMFSKHNVFSDPPFLRQDLISCRNLLIYFNAKLQVTVMNLFHYALNPVGILFLGKSEALGHAISLFQPIDNKSKIFQRKLVAPYEAVRSARASFSTVSKSEGSTKVRTTAKTSHEFPDAVIAAVAADSLLIDENMNVIRIYGDVQAYTQLAAGEVSTNLASIARREFRQELRALVFKVVRENMESAVLSKKLDINGMMHKVNIMIRPLKLKSSPDQLLLISFEKFKRVHEARVDSKKSDIDPHVAELEQELAATKEHLQTVVEELETSNEELQSTNEELQSTNEELQSANEELETSNEELQSTNEELLTVNEELQIKSIEHSAINEDLENIKESIDMAMLVVDQGLRLTRYNKEAHKIFMLTDDSIGGSVSSIGTRIDIPELRKHVLKVIGTGQMQTRQLEEHDSVFYNERITPYKDGDGIVKGAVLTYIDSTQEQLALKKLQRSEERYNLAAEGANAGMWDWDIVRDDMHWSELLMRMLGIKDRNFKPSMDKLKELIHIEDRKDVMDILSAHLERGFDFDVEFRMRRKDGSYFGAHASGQAKWNDNKEPVRMTGFIYDVTERRMALDQLSRINESLERFAYVCSHDLKEPARSIENFAALALKSLNTKIDEEELSYLQFIHSGAQRMQEMIKGILSYSQLKNKNLVKRDLNLELELEKVLDNLTLSIQESNATITHDPLPWIHADKMQIIQLLQNLIGNALKFNKKESPLIHISAEQDGEEWIISIRDNGIGIKPEHTHKIFNVFQRLNRKEEYPGTGIGLSICDKIVSNHGGRIWVESKPSVGSTFMFTVPAGKNKQVNGNEVKQGGAMSRRDTSLS